MSLNANDINLRVGFDVDRFTAELQKTNSLMNKWGTQMQGYIRSAFGFTAAIYATREMIGTLAQFERSMSEVKAITGATGKEFDALRNNAITLAGAFNSIEISKLETEFGRLGFSNKEILQSTQATINLASATGSDLATSATIAGSTLRAFNLDAKEMGRVTDVMAGALNRTGLDMTNFAEAIKYVAPNAHAAGISLEETAAMLGILADNGIKGSMAGTSLRRIITDLSTEAKPLNEKLKELGAKGLNAADAMTEIGRIGATSLLVLAKNADKASTLTKALHNVNGEAQLMSDIMQDNLIGDWKKLNAEWDKIIVNQGKVNGFGRDLAQNATNQLKVWGSDKISLFEKVFGGSGDYQRFAEIVDKANGKLGEARQFSISNNDAKGANQSTTAAKGGWVDEILNKSDKAADKIKQVVIPTVNDLQEKIKQTNELIKASGSGSQIDIYKNQIEALELQIFKLLNNAELVKAKLHAASPDNTLPSSGIQQLDVADPGSKLAESFAKVKPKITSLVERYKGLFDGFHLSTQRLGYAFVSMGSNISTGLSQAIAGTMPFAQAMAQMAMSVVDSLERIALAYMIENSAKFGVAGIAAAVIGFTAIKTLFASIGKSSVGSAAVSSGGRLSNSVGSQTMNIQLSGQLTARGSDLAYVLDKQGYKAGRIGG